MRFFCQESATKMLYGWFSWVTESFKSGGVGSVSYMGNLVVDFYEDLTIALFFCLTWVASKSIQIIIEDVQSHSPSVQPSGHRVMWWKRSYCLIINFVQAVGHFFEVALFLFVLKQFLLFFLFFVHSVFFTLFLGNSHLISFYVAHLLKNILLMSIIVFGSQNLKKKADLLVDELTTWRYFKSTAQSEVTTQANQQFLICNQQFL